MKAHEVGAPGHVNRLDVGARPCARYADTTQAPPMATRVSLLDGFSVTSHGTAVALLPSAQRLVAFLALHQGAVSRAYVSGRLWLNRTPRQSSASLRSALWRTRAGGCALMEATNDQLRLADDVTVDVREVSATARRLIDISAECDATDLDPTRLSGELLPDWYDDWVLLEREHVRHLYLRGLEALSRRLVGLGRFAEAIQAGLMATQLEPLCESAQRALVEAHLAEGNYSEALRQYHRYQCVLGDELGLEPSRNFRRLLGALDGMTARHLGHEPRLAGP